MSARSRLTKGGAGLALAATAVVAAAAMGIVGIRNAAIDAPSGTSAAAGAKGASAQPPGPAAGQSSDTYIIVYDSEQPLATYQGGVKGLAAPQRMKSLDGSSPGRLAVKSADARAYVSYVQGRQIAHENKISALIGRQLRVERRMQHALNAAVVEMSATEAERVRQLSEVALVEAYREYEQDTDAGPALIGAPALWNATPTAYKGEGVVFGIIDSGINFGSPSFAGTDQNGYTHVNPLGAGTYLGSCAPGGADAGRCNDKLIGGYDFVCNAPGNTCGTANIREEPGFGDTNSHGSHTASTAAGNFRTATFSGNTVNLSGVAPHANIVAYDACYTNTATGQGLCPNVSTLASVNQAIADGIVDVINYSIGGGSVPWGEAVSLAFLNATDAGIYVATSAGNDGPGANTLGHLEPWTGTTAAATHGRGAFAFALQITGPGTVPAELSPVVLTASTAGVAITQSIPGTTPVVVSPTWGTLNDGCSAFPAGTFQSAIAVISRNSANCTFSLRAQNAANAGAVVAVVVNYLDALGTSGAATIPLLTATPASGNALQAFYAAHPGAVTGGIGYPPLALPRVPDVLAAFSSRGPSLGLDVLKPDITAPGVDILATIAGTTLTGSENAVGLISGTSMSSPHHAGAAGLLRQAKPTWTVAEIKSALMMTAKQEVFKENGITQATPHDMGAGRIQVDQAINAGLVLNEVKANFLAANPATGGDVSALNLPSLGKNSCFNTCTFTRTFRNTLATRQAWTAKVQGLSGTVSPSLFTLNPGESKAVKVTISSAALAANGVYNFGKLVLAPQGGVTAQPTLRLPIAVAVQPPRVALPALINATLPQGGVGTAATSVGNIGGSVLQYAIDGTGTGALVLANAPRGAVSNGFASSILTDFPGSAFFQADDFTLSGSTRITALFTEGFTPPSGPLSNVTTQLTWSIYPDAGGMPAGNPQTAPGAASWTYAAAPVSTGVTISNTGQINNIRLDLTQAGQNVVLPAGRYWLVVNARTTNANRWVWFASNNAAGGFMSLGTGLAGNGLWTANNAFGGLAMRIDGLVQCGAPWMVSYSPASGNVSPGASRATTINLSAAGLTAGTYTGNLCVASNDPALPRAASPVRLTVTP